MVGAYLILPPVAVPHLAAPPSSALRSCPESESYCCRIGPDQLGAQSRVKLSVLAGWSEAPPAARKQEFGADMMSLRHFSTIAVAALALRTNQSPADSTDARCDIYLKGSDHTDKMIPCVFSRC